ncbi:MAG: nuclease [Thermoplasmata archaeon]|nr:MAG: nuclease [Thermoplasmata archaeon]
MDSIVLDTSVVVKSVLEPPKSLPLNVYKREVGTRRKIHVILEILEARGYTVYFPRAGIVEVASVLKQSGLGRQDIMKLVESIEETFIVVNENVIYSKALEVAIDRSPSGFDTYFIALAIITNSILITDDKPMASHAKSLDVEVVLVKETSLEHIREKLIGK